MCQRKKYSLAPHHSVKKRARFQIYNQETDNILMINQGMNYAWTPKDFYCMKHDSFFVNGGGCPMDKEWHELTPEQKREERFQKWLSPPDIQFKSPEAQQTYKERATRIYNALRVREPDRVPVTLPIGNFPAYYAGKTLQDVMYDYEELRRVWTRFMYDFYEDMDTFNGPFLTYSGKVLEILDYKLYRWPGKGLGSEVNTYQFMEGEYMTADEYDTMIKDPSDFALRWIIPRTIGAMAPVKKSMSFSSLLSRPLNITMPFAVPEIRQAFQAMIRAGEEYEIWLKSVLAFNREALAAGFPSLRGGMAVAPFDTIGDSLRGTRGAIMDIYRQPEKLLEALDVITRLTVKNTIATVNATGGFMVTFPLHKGDDTFMSNEQFERFYWPSLREVILNLMDEGIMVMLFAEGRYEKRLDMIKDFPKGWVSWHFDQTDMEKAKRALGDMNCIMGNVPSSLMVSGTPKEVKDYCCNLIEKCGKGGGYILAGGCSATESNPDNFRAMMQAVRECGVYG